MIGIDLLEIGRFEEAFRRRGEGFLRRIFTERELNYFYRLGPKRVVIAELAARFAAKEAVSKALGTGIKLLGSEGKVGVSWKEIEVLTKSSGKPVVVLSGRARKKAKKLGFKKVHVNQRSCSSHSFGRKGLSRLSGRLFISIDLRNAVLLLAEAVYLKTGSASTSRLIYLVRIFYI